MEVADLANPVEMADLQNAVLLEGSGSDATFQQFIID